MALNLSGFVTPEQDFGGLYRASDKLERRQYREDQMRERQAGKRAATAKFLTDYLDPKDHLTGTNYDPQIVKGFNDLLSEAAALANEGADTSTLLMALTPKVNKLSQYSTTAKLVGQRLKDQLSKIKPGMGYDIPKLEEEARRAAFYNPDGSFKDITQVDPNTDWISEVIKMSPEKVTNDAAIDEFVKNSPKFTNTTDITAYTPTGGMSRKKVKITSPNWLTQDTDERGAMTGLVPKYQVALDDGQPQMHEFIDADGKKVQAPVRLLDEKEFNSLLGSNPGIADWVRGQVRMANPDIDLNSTQAKNAARAIMYDELKRRMPGGIEDVEIQNKPSAPEIRLNLGYPAYRSGSRSGGGGEEPGLRDIYKEVKDATEIRGRKEKGKGVPLNELSATAQGIIIQYANKLTDDDLTQADIYIKQNNDGSINIIRAEDNSLIAPIDFDDVNIPAQPGVKEKREVNKISEKKQKEKEQQSKKPASGIKWK